MKRPITRERYLPLDRTLNELVKRRGFPAAAAALAGLRPQTPERPRPPQMSEADIAEFQEYVDAHLWIPGSGISPSRHIRTHFEKWREKGLTLAQIRKAQRALARAYNSELQRHPKRRIEWLRVQVHGNPGGPPAIRPAAELSEEELKERRDYNKRAQDESRRRRKKKTDEPGPA